MKSIREELRKGVRASLDFESPDGVADLRDLDLYLCGVNPSNPEERPTPQQGERGEKPAKCILHFGRVVAALNYRRLARELKDADPLLFPPGASDENVPFEEKIIRTTVGRYVPLTRESFPSTLEEDPSSSSSSSSWSTDALRAARAPLAPDDPVPEGYEATMEGDNRDTWWVGQVSCKAKEGFKALNKKETPPGYYVPIGDMRDLEYSAVPDCHNVDIALVIEPTWYASEAALASGGPLRLTDFEVARIPRAPRYQGDGKEQTTSDPKIGCVGQYVEVTGRNAEELVTHLKARVAERTEPQRQGLSMPREALNLKCAAAEKVRRESGAEAKATGKGKKKKQVMMTMKQQQQQKKKKKKRTQNDAEGSSESSSSGKWSAPATPETKTKKRKQQQQQQQQQQQPAKKRARGGVLQLADGSALSSSSSSSSQRRSPIAKGDRVWVAKWGRGYEYEVEELPASAMALVPLSFIRSTVDDSDDLDAQAPLSSLRRCSS